MIGRIDEVVVDCAAPTRLAQFWAGVATSQAEELGARRMGDIHSDSAGTFQVLLDPEGNEWCLVRCT